MDSYGGTYMKLKGGVWIIYYFAVACLILFTTVVIVKLTFWPACTVTDTSVVISQNKVNIVPVCVDGWSIAGIAATVLGVGGAILTLIGALAVAAWWIELHNRVEAQVNALYEEQKERIDLRTNTFLKELEEDFNQRFLTINSKIEKIDEVMGKTQCFISFLFEMTLPIPSTITLEEYEILGERLEKAITATSIDAVPPLLLIQHVRKMSMLALSQLDQCLSKTSTYDSKTPSVEVTALTKEMELWEKHAYFWSRYYFVMLTNSSENSAESETSLENLQEKIKIAAQRLDAWRKQHQIKGKNQ
jgi:hypothetical protein